jgi:hypothetical protein
VVFGNESDEHVQRVKFGQKPKFKFKTFEHEEILLEVFNVRNKIVNITILFIYLIFSGYPKICCKDD